MDSSVNPQPTDAHIRISHEIHRELIRRKFSQRQRDVIDFILTLSWGCGKPSAIIPELKDFAETGIGKNHIRGVLNELLQGNVILWDKEMNTFQLNKYYDLWSIETVVSANPKRFKELINLNLARPSPNLLKSTVPEKGTEFPKGEPSSQKGDRVPKRGTEFPKEEPGSRKGDRVPEKGTEFLKRELVSSQKGNRPVPKRGTVTRNYPSRIMGSSVSKASIKAIKRFKRTTTTITTTMSTSADTLRMNPELYSIQNIKLDYKNNFIAGGKLTSFDENDLETLHGTYGGEWLHSAMRAAYRLGIDKRNLAYIQGILRGYRERGGMDKLESKISVVASATPPSPRSNERSRNQGGRSRKSEIPILTDYGGGAIPSADEMAELMRKAQEIKETKALEKVEVSNR
ncbi:replication protein [Paenibacillus sp. FSL H3-0469]|uniref:replication protein n=1 Tax=Paenibacillus sp. FSL H3-0469 TaxID=2954506 RepID=UPI003101860B